jgi:hypothetical protein
MFHANAYGLDRIVRSLRRYAAAGQPMLEPHPFLVACARGGAGISEPAARV